MDRLCAGLAGEASRVRSGSAAGRRDGVLQRAGCARPPRREPQSYLDRFWDRALATFKLAAEQEDS
jgi:hypothetical protein